MIKQEKNQNNASANRSKKPFIAAISVICALVVLITVFLLCKNSVYFSLAQSKAEKNEFSAAMRIAEKSSSDESAVLSKYLALRFDINRSYPELLAEFSIDKINEWIQTTVYLTENSDVLGQTLSSQVEAMNQKLVRISECHSQYGSMRSEVLAMMDVFAEFNRLYSTASDGKNTSFTVGEERAKIATWEQQNSNLMNFAATVPGYENIYLLNYLIKEVQGECGDLREAMNSVVAMGYTETDLIRLSGSAQKKFPSIQNSNNESVNVLEKENYERYMFDSICKQLVEGLGEFYAV